VGEEEKEICYENTKWKYRHGRGYAISARTKADEAWRLIEAGARPGRGWDVPQAIDELKTPWAPVALAYHPESGLFALDQFGRVYRVGVGGKNE
jgi:hypothetical protein